MEEVKTKISRTFEEKLVLFCKFSTIYHLLMVPVIIFLGNWLVQLVDKMGDWMGMSMIDTGKNDFWIVPIIGLFLTMALCYFRAFRTLERIDWLELPILAHGITAISFLIYYFVDVSSLAYLLASILEFVFFFATAFFWMAQKKVIDT